MLSVGAASAQDALQVARARYAAAAYEEALAALGDSGSDGSAASIEAETVRAFCLVALDKVQDAERVIEAILLANPRYAPGVNDTAPRIQAAFGRVRGRVLPALIRDRYERARSAFEAKDRAAAAEGFDSAIALIDSADPETRAALDEIRFLAVGFRDLSRALSAEQPRDNAEDPPEPGADRRRDVASVQIVPAVAIRQSMPTWVPPESARRMMFTGAIRVSIGADGQVDGAEIVRPVHPLFDSRLLVAARSWIYRPATRDGAPIRSERVVEVQLKSIQ
jgi:hypothetical protein